MRLLFQDLLHLFLQAQTSIRSPPKVDNFARVILQGRACSKRYGFNGVNDYHALSNNDVLHRLWLPPIDVELRVRRLRFWQTVASDPTNHRQIIAAYFGHFDGERQMFDNNGIHLQHAHPWMHQLCEDVGALSIVEDAAYMINAIVNDPRLIFDDEYKAQFCEIDVSVLRAQTQTHAIPPPGYQPPNNGDNGEISMSMPNLSFAISCVGGTFVAPPIQQTEPSLHINGFQNSKAMDVDPMFQDSFSTMSAHGA